MIRTFIISLTSLIAITAFLLYLFVIDTRDPEKVFIRNFTVQVNADNMHCRLKFDDQYTLLSTENYSQYPRMLSMGHAIQPNDLYVFSHGDHTISMDAWLLADLTEIDDTAHCKMTLSGTVSNPNETLFEGEAILIAMVDKNHQVIIRSSSDHYDKTIHEDEYKRPTKISVKQAFPTITYF